MIVLYGEVEGGDTQMPLDRKDWALLAIANAGHGVSLSPVQLQKSLFLLGRELGSKVGANFYDFQPYTTDRSISTFIGMPKH